MAEFKPGDLVQLKSGGPKMTVHTEDRGVVKCQWFAVMKLESGLFSPDSLRATHETETPKKAQEVPSASRKHGGMGAR